MPGPPLLLLHAMIAAGPAGCRWLADVSGTDFCGMLR